MRYFKICKDFILFSKLTLILKPLGKAFHFIYYFNHLRLWISKYKHLPLMNDFYVVERFYDKRYNMFDAIINAYNLKQEKVLYLEFGVAQAHSFKWWLQALPNTENRFVGFDTFEGLPEDWGGFFKKGDMKGTIPNLDDSRASFYKGIFQHTLHPYIQEHTDELKHTKKIIHLDADLFSATLFTLSQLYPYLKKGDIILFDEFNVATHEFAAFKIFQESFYVQLKPIAAVNNYYQVAFEVQ